MDLAQGGDGHLHACMLIRDLYTDKLCDVAILDKQYLARLARWTLEQDLPFQ